VIGNGFLREALEHEMFDCTVLDFVLRKAAPLYHRGDVAVASEKASLMCAMRQMVRLKTQQVVLVDEHDKVVALLAASRVCELLERFFGQTAIASQHVASRFDIMMSSLVFATTPSAVLSRAFQFMLEKRVSALAVVDGVHKELVGSLSLSDVATLLDSELFFGTARGTVGTFLGTKASAPHSVERPKVIAVTPTDTYGDVLRLIVAYKVHRVWVVEPKHKSPIAVVSAWDVMRFVVTDGESKPELVLFDESE
jgi:CBS domain-containing protein